MKMMELSAEDNIMFYVLWLPWLTFIDVDLRVLDR